MKKKIVGLLLVVVMLVAMVACSNDTPAEKANITEGYYTFSYQADSVGTMARFFHFYEDTGYGAVVYFGAQSGNYGQMGSVAFYSVEEKPYDYAVWNSRSDVVKDEATQTVNTDTAVKGTAKYTVTFKSVEDGTVLGTCGWDGDYLYLGNPDQIGFVNQGGQTDSHNMKFAHDKDGSKNSSAYGNESSQAVFTFYKTADNYILINHDGTYTDAVGDSIINGTYTYDKDTKAFTLKDGATVTAEESAITYKNGSVTETLSKTVPAPVDPDPTGGEKTVLYTLEGSAYSGQVVAKLELYSDGTCTYDCGNGAVVVNGTYTTEDLQGQAIPKTVTLEGCEAVEVTMNFTDMQMEIEMPALAESQIPSVTVTMSLGAPAPEEKTVLYTLEGSAYSGQVVATLELYSDGTCAYDCGNGTVVVNGTYTTEDLQGNAVPKTVTLEGCETVEVTMNFTDMQMEVEMPALADYQIPSVTVTMALGQ